MSFILRACSQNKSVAELTEPKLAADEGFQHASDEQTEAVDVAPVEAQVALLGTLLARLEEVDEFLKEEGRGVAVEVWLGQLRFEKERGSLEH